MKMPPRKVATDVMALPASDFAQRLREALLAKVEAQLDVEALADALASEVAEKVIGNISLESLQQEVMARVGEKLVTDGDLCARVAAVIAERFG
jgi:hypothetical protein